MQKFELLHITISSKCQSSHLGFTQNVTGCLLNILVPANINQKQFLFEEEFIIFLEFQIDFYIYNFLFDVLLLLAKLLIIRAKIYDVNLLFLTTTYT